MKRFLVATVAAILGFSLSACSTPSEEKVKQSGQSLSGAFEQSRGDYVESSQSGGTENIGGLLEEQVVIAAESLENLLLFLSSNNFGASEVLRSTGFTADEIIAGAGDETTRDILLDFLPQNFLANEGATLREELITYAYLTKTASVFDHWGGETRFSVPLELLQVGKDSVTTLPNGEGIFPENLKEEALLGIMYATTPSYTLIPVDKNNAAAWAAWGVDVSAFAKSVQELESMPNKLGEGIIDNE